MKNNHTFLPVAAETGSHEMNIELKNVNAVNSSKEQLKVSQDTLNDGDMKSDHVTNQITNNDEKGKINVGYSGVCDNEIASKDAYQLPTTMEAEKEANWYQRHKSQLFTAFYIILALLYLCYFVAAMCVRKFDHNSIYLILLTVFFGGIIGWNILDSRFRLQNRISHYMEEFSTSEHGERLQTIIRWFMRLLAIAVALWVIIDVGIRRPWSLISLAGIAFFVILFYLFSIDRSKIRWHTVFWGLMLQLLIAIIIIKTREGYMLFHWIGDKITDFLTHSTVGSEFVFGEAYTKHMFVFKVMPMVVFFSSVMSILYYWGVMQSVVRVFGRLLAFTMDTTPAESISAASNIFVGMTEAPLIVKPFLADMTLSELHAVMTGGFATIAGSLLGLYISYGVKAQHLISASVMSAPAALAMSKLIYPETKSSKASTKDYNKLNIGDQKNAIDAASSGASQSIKLIANIVVNLIAFLSILSFVNAALTWFGQRVNIEKLTFEKISSYLLYPLAFLMGAAKDDCLQVGQLLGLKTFLNEMIAYQKLSTFIDNREIFENYTKYFNSTDSWTYIKNDIYLNKTQQTLIGGFMTERSEVISTYALCGFANIGSIGIMLGGLTILAPQRRDDLVKMVIRAMVAGNVACFLTACISGLMLETV